MGLLDNLQITKPVKRCKVRTILETLEPADQTKLEEAIKTWPLRTLERELRKLGIEISDTPMYSHRDGHCSCSKI